MEFKEAIKEKRKQLGLNQIEAATILKVSLATLQSWEVGRRQPTEYGQAEILRRFDQIFAFVDVYREKERNEE